LHLFGIDQAVEDLAAWPTGPHLPPLFLQNIIPVLASEATAGWKRLSAALNHAKRPPAKPYWRGAV